MSTDDKFMFGTENYSRQASNNMNHFETDCSKYVDHDK